MVNTHQHQFQKSSASIRPGVLTLKPSSFWLTVEPTHSHTHTFTDPDNNTQLLTLTHTRKLPACAPFRSVPLVTLALNRRRGARCLSIVILSLHSFLMSFTAHNQLPAEKCHHTTSLIQP